MFIKCILNLEQSWERLLSCKCGQCDNVVQLSTHICISSTASIQETLKNDTSHAISYSRKTTCSSEDVVKEGRGRPEEDRDGAEDEKICNAFMATPWQKAHLSRRQPNSHLLLSSVLPSSLSLPGYSLKSELRSHCTKLHTNAKLHLLPHEHHLPTLYISSHSGN